LHLGQRTANATDSPPKTPAQSRGSALIAEWLIFCLKRARLCIALVLVCGATLAPSSLFAFTLPQYFDNTNAKITAQVDFLRPSQLGIDPKDIASLYQNQFTPQQRQLILTGFNEPELWLRVKLINYLGKAIPAVMVFDTESDVKIQQFDITGTRLNHVGGPLPFTLTDNPNALMGFPLTIGPGAVTLFFKIDSKEPVHMEMSLHSPASYNQLSYKNLILDLLQLLPLLVMSLVVLALGMSSRDGSSLLISGIILSVAINRMAQAGLISPLVYLPYIDLTFRNTANLVTTIFLILLVNEVLPAVTKYHKRIRVTAAISVSLLVLYGISSHSLQSTGQLLLFTLVVNSLVAARLLLSGKAGTGWIRFGMGGLVFYNLSTLMMLLGVIDNLDYLHFYAKLVQDLGLLGMSLHSVTRIIHQQNNQDDSNLSHILQIILTKVHKDIQMPANGVLEMSKLLVETNLSVKQHELLNTIRLSGAELVQKSHEIDAVNRLYGKQAMGEPEPVMLSEFLQDIVKSSYQDAALKGVELMVEIRPNVPKKTLIHKDMLNLVLSSLIRNAIQYTFVGDIVLTASLDNAGHVRFRVTDSGVGMSPDKMRTLFQFKERQLGSASITLPLCSQIIAALGGRLGVSSQTNDGTSFWFSLDLPQIEISEKQTSKGTHMDHNVKILIADENKNNRRVVRHLAESFGISVDTCASGSEAMALLQTKAQLDQHYDFVLIDQNLTNMSATQVAHRIHESSTLRSSLKIILMHAQFISPDNSDHLDLGFDGLLQKPISSQNLYNTFNAFMPQIDLDKS